MRNVSSGILILLLTLATGPGPAQAQSYPCGGTEESCAPEAKPAQAIARATDRHPGKSPTGVAVSGQACAASSGDAMLAAMKACADYCGRENCRIDEKATQWHEYAAKIDLQPSGSAWGTECFYTASAVAVSGACTEQ
jgi:hypothetical protein